MDSIMMVDKQEIETILALDKERTQSKWRAYGNYGLRGAPEDYKLSQLLMDERVKGEFITPDTEFIAKAPRMASIIRELWDEQQWQDISTAPKDKTILIGFFNPLNKWRTVKAMYFSKHTHETDCDYSDWHEYNEEDETYYIPEGWYEDVYAETGLDYTYIHLSDINPTKWMHLPSQPKAQDDD